MTELTNTKPAVPVLDKAIRILTELATNEGEATSSGLARKVGVSQPTCYRILKTLEAADWIRPNDRNGYSLSSGLLPLVRPFLDQHRLGQAVQPVLDSAANELGVTAKLSLQAGQEQVTLAFAAPPRAYSVIAPVGSRYPVSWGASGASLLSALNDKAIAKIIAATNVWEACTPDDVWERIEAVRQTGVCENIGHDPRGIDTLSARIPVNSHSLAITLIALRGDIDPNRLPAIKNRLKAAAQEAADRIGSI